MLSPTCSLGCVITSRHHDNVVEAGLESGDTSVKASAVCKSKIFLETIMRDGNASIIIEPGARFRCVLPSSSHYNGYNRATTQCSWFAYDNGSCLCEE